MKTIEQRVTNGINWLNKVKPRWKKKIDVESLEMTSSYTCVCGQIFGDYWKKNEKETRKNL